MKKQYVYLNGRQVPADQAMVPVTDRGFLYGDGVFDTMHAQAGVVFRLDAHLTRLQAAGTVTGIAVPEQSVLKRAVHALLKKNGCTGSAYIRITVSRGSGGKRLAPATDMIPTVLIVARPQTPVPASHYRTGLKTCIVTPRRNSKSPESGIKSLNYLPNILGKAEAETAGCGEGIMLNEKGYIACGTVSNVFFIRNDILITPPLSTGILPGITRQLIINDVAPAREIDVQQRNVRPAEIKKMDGAFVTNSLWKLMPIKTMGTVNFKRPALLRKLQQVFRKLPVV